MRRLVNIMNNFSLTRLLKSLICLLFVPIFLKLSILTLIISLFIMGRRTLFLSLTLGEILIRHRFKF